MKELRQAHCYPVGIIGKAFGESKNGYYAWLKVAFRRAKKLGCSWRQLSRQPMSEDVAPIVRSDCKRNLSKLMALLLAGKNCDSSEEVREYVEIFHNRQRQQARLGYLSPVAFVRQYYKQQKAA